MKSFADWTQELAESVGSVEHHWETRKEASYPLEVAYYECANCMKIAYLYEYSTYGKGYNVCSSCLHVLTGGTP